MYPIWTSNDVDLLLLRLSSGSWRPCLDCRQCLKLSGILNWSLLDRIGHSWACTVLPKDRELTYLVRCPLFRSLYWLDLPGWIWLDWSGLSLAGLAWYFWM
ncbi:hypothetical protein TNIN_276151 [Trichonephila inaurata madagascariensis]|uniref:Uncharacterized protein n=1 Tax=Trichonephila inaurata madagascariensis TaxID=2747483 RepID=A0A8X6Y5A3_9ARAC|nr:hypothetical protein TNIN_276151 [Trichonephila inaurata madagascariensis]